MGVGDEVEEGHEEDADHQTVQTKPTTANVIPRTVNVSTRLPRKQHDAKEEANEARVGVEAEEDHEEEADHHAVQTKHATANVIAVKRHSVKEATDEATSSLISSSWQ
ncbi:unnamed protein product [Prorocentrum cordatum]|uniref:Uncharacterized protein n=1 Tax=Prorocentrum cordatum TaxID=2364126 RepID=A0ABN9UQ48_9DINO|nr:unnamed protein product [Polarella glacialis]